MDAATLGFLIALVVLAVACLALLIGLVIMGTHLAHKVHRILKSPQYLSQLIVGLLGKS